MQYLLATNGKLPQEYGGSLPSAHQGCDLSLWNDEVQVLQDWSVLSKGICEFHILELQRASVSSFNSCTAYKRQKPSANRALHVTVAAPVKVCLAITRGFDLSVSLWP